MATLNLGTAGQDLVNFKRGLSQLFNVGEGKNLNELERQQVGAATQQAKTQGQTAVTENVHQQNLYNLFQKHLRGEVPSTEESLAGIKAVEAERAGRENVAEGAFMSGEGKGYTPKVAGEAAGVAATRAGTQNTQSVTELNRLEGVLKGMTNKGLGRDLALNEASGKPTSTLGVQTTIPPGEVERTAAAKAHSLAQTLMSVIGYPEEQQMKVLEPLVGDYPQLKPTVEKYQSKQRIIQYQGDQSKLRVLNNELADLAKRADVPHVPVRTPEEYRVRKAYLQRLPQAPTSTYGPATRMLPQGY